MQKAAKYVAVLVKFLKCNLWPILVSDKDENGASTGVGSGLWRPRNMSGKRVMSARFCRLNRLLP
jgi:hypothetical protein